MEILENITYRFLIDFLNKFVSRKIAISWEEINKECSIEIKFYLRSKGKVDVYLTELNLFKEKIGDYYVRPIRPTAWTSAEYYYRFNTHQINFFFVLFLLTEEELKRAIENNDSLLDVPDKETYERSEDLRYTDNIESIMTEQKWKEMEFLNVYERVISRYDTRGLTLQKTKLKEPLDSLYKRYKRNNPDFAAVMYKYIDIMSMIVETYDKDGLESAAPYQANENTNLSPDDLLSVKEAAEYVGRSQQTIYGWTTNDLIDYLKEANGRIYIKRKFLDNYKSSRNHKSHANLKSESLADEIINNSF